MAMASAKRIWPSHRSLMAAIISLAAAYDK